MTQKVEKEQMDEKTWKEQVAALGELPPPTIERKEACYHLVISKVIKDDFTYRCDNCGSIIEIVGSFMYTPEQYALKAGVILVKTASEDERVKGIVTTILEEVGKEPQPEEAPDA